MTNLVADRLRVNKLSLQVPAWVALAVARLTEVPGHRAGASARSCAAAIGGWQGGSPKLGQLRQRGGVALVRAHRSDGPAHGGRHHDTRRNNAFKVTSGRSTSCILVLLFRERPPASTSTELPTARALSSSLIFDIIDCSTSVAEKSYGVDVLLRELSYVLLCYLIQPTTDDGRGGKDDRGREARRLATDRGARSRARRGRARVEQRCCSPRPTMPEPQPTTTPTPQAQSGADA
jgi:hypothetical protein